MFTNVQSATDLSFETHHDANVDHVGFESLCPRTSINVQGHPPQTVLVTTAAMPPDHHADAFLARHSPQSLIER